MSQPVFECVFSKKNKDPPQDETLMSHDLSQSPQAKLWSDIVQGHKRSA